MLTILRKPKKELEFTEYHARTSTISFASLPQPFHKLDDPRFANKEIEAWGDEKVCPSRAPKSMIVLSWLATIRYVLVCQKWQLRGFSQSSAYVFESLIR